MTMLRAQSYTSKFNNNSIQFIHIVCAHMISICVCKYTIARACATTAQQPGKDMDLQCPALGADKRGRMRVCAAQAAASHTMPTWDSASCTPRRVLMTGGLCRCDCNWRTPNFGRLGYCCKSFGLRASIGLMRAISEDPTRTPLGAIGMNCRGS